METTSRARIRAGDPAAFGRLFDEHASVVHRHALRVTGDWATAEDVVSLTFLEAWRLRERIRDEGDSLRPWLLGIAVNVLRNTTRAARRHQFALTRMPRPQSVPDPAEEVVGRAADAERLAAARVALEKLRPAEREVFTLCVWEGLGYAEVAEALGVATGTVRSRLARARARLRKLTQAELAGGRGRPRFGGSDREPPADGGQQVGDRAHAVWSLQEGHR
ncbi:RNA polymerase sigma factor [Spirillospora sp. CA-253888]